MDNADSLKHPEHVIHETCVAFLVTEVPIANFFFLDGRLSYLFQLTHLLNLIILKKFYVVISNFHYIKTNVHTLT